MAEILSIPPVIYDFTLFHECSNSDFTSSNAKREIKGDGSLMNFIKWDAKGTTSQTYDAGGKTKFGVTENIAWKEFINLMDKNYDKNIDTMGKKEWCEVIEWFWNGKGKGEGACGECANYACALLLFNAIWLGFKGTNQLLSALKTNADIKDYPFIDDGSVYKKIADATKAYTEPMSAYNCMKKAYTSYLYNISAPGKKNSVNRMGWLKRVAFEYTPYGLYVQPVVDVYKNMGLKSSSTLEQWNTASTKAAKENVKHFVKIFDWGVSSESVEDMESFLDNFYYPGSVVDDVYGYDNSSSNTSSYSGAYSGCGNIQQLGDYTNAPDLDKVKQQSQKRESILNTLVGGLNTSNDIKKCEELLSSDKKKGSKIKSEN